MDLYISPQTHDFEKNAAEVTLPENANSWPNEIMQELYKQVPYIADFDPEVVMDRVDAERGYGFGHVEIRNKTELQQNASEQALQAVGVQQVRVPVIIKDRKLYPFDVIITQDSKALPLTETRMRQALFRPQAFDVTSRTPGDQSMVGQLYPPYRQNYGGAGGGTGMSVGMGKEGAANVPNSTTPDTGGGIKVKDLVPKAKSASVLSAVLPTISVDDYTKFASELEDHSLQALYLKNRAATSPALQKLANFIPGTASKTAAVLEDRVRPNVVQVTKLAEGYRFRTANTNYWQPAEKIVDRGYVTRALGEKIATAADMTGSVTLAEGDGVKDHSPESHPELIASFGVYRVRDEEGQELVGFVFPNLLDIDGTSMPIALFTNGSATALQESIAGESVGKDSGLVFGPQTGHGMFVRQLQNGGVDAMVPMTIKGGYAEGGSHKMHVETYDGREVFVEVQPNIQHPTEVDGTCIVPEDFRWMPLGGEAVSLVEHPADWGQAKEASRSFASVTLRAGDINSFSLSGFPLEKFAAADRTFLSIDDVFFVLAGLGTDLTYASEKIAEVLMTSAPTEVRVGRHIKLAGEVRTEATKTAEAFLAGVPDLRRSLIKEAAYVPDPVAVDTVLSIGFINPENLMTFVSYLPQMDIAQERLCELLVASRLGLTDVPTSPLEKSIKSLEEVLEGLKVLAFQKS